MIQSWYPGEDAMTQEPVVQYERDGRVARITLNRPEHLNAISDAMPGDLKAAVERANTDDAVHVIALSGAGRAFCAGYDLKAYAEAPRPVKGSQAMPGEIGRASGREGWGQEGSI